MRYVMTKIRGLSDALPESMFGVLEYEEEIQEFEKALAEKKRLLENKKKEIAERSPVYDIAISLHAIFCKWNHTDGCSWFYEINEREGKTNWGGYAHKEYLQKANKFLAAAEKENISNVQGILNVISSVK